MGRLGVRSITGVALVVPPFLLLRGIASVVVSFGLMSIGVGVGRGASRIMTLVMTLLVLSGVAGAMLFLVVTFLFLLRYIASTMVSIAVIFLIFLSGVARLPWFLVSLMILKI